MLSKEPGSHPLALLSSACSQGALLITKWLLQPGSKLTTASTEQRSRDGERAFSPTFHERQKHFPEATTGLLTSLSRLGYRWSKVDFSRKKP